MLLWRPIVGAPRDGTLILVALIRDGKVWRVSDAKFNGIGWYDAVGAHGVFWATHWAPMPFIAID